jgi:ferredoxin-NADP reductase
MKIFSFKTKVVGREDLTPDTILLKMGCVDGFTFESGQFITLFIEKDGERKPRSYSIFSDPKSEGCFDLCIKIVDGGYASDIFANAKVGDEFDCKGPFGHFKFNKEDSNSKICMIGTGTGVAPLYSMLNDNLGVSSKEFHLIFGVRYVRDLILLDELDKMQKEFSNFTYDIAVSREEFRGKQGRVTTVLPSDCEDTTFYICGLKDMVFSVKDLLVSKGVDIKNIKFERYD